MNRSKKGFLKDVKHELKMLKKNATNREITKLINNNAKFDGDSRSNCVYGQLTGNCTNERAKELMDISCIRVVHKEIDGHRINIEQSFENLQPLINGPYKGQMWGDFTKVRFFNYFSALEAYILMDDANIEGIKEYLKGNTNKLEL